MIQLATSRRDNKLQQYFSTESAGITAASSCLSLTNCSLYDGTDFLSHADDPLLEFDGAFTFLQWYKRSSTGGQSYGGLCSKRQSLFSTGSSIDMNANRSTATLDYFVRVSDNSKSVTIEGLAAANDTWHVNQWGFDPANTRIFLGVDGGTFQFKSDALLTSINTSAQDFKIGKGHATATQFSGRIGATYLMLGSVFDTWTKTYDHNNSTTPLAKCELHTDIQDAITVGWELEDDLVTDVEGGLSDLTNNNTVTLVTI